MKLRFLLILSIASISAIMLDGPIIPKRVLILYAGGTIGMEKNENNVYVPSPNKFFQKLKSNPRMHDPSLAERYAQNPTGKELILPKSGKVIISYDFVEYDPLLDSSNMQSSDWIKIAGDIKKNYSDYNGFVILHGTDTLTYTSSALSFMLEGLQKPVILTGSQIPIFEHRSDAENHILTSLILAGSYDIPEVCIFFANKLIRGNRATKISSTNFEAFDSLNYMPLAHIGTEISLNKGYIMRPSCAPFEASTRLNSHVGILRFFPTITPQMIKASIKSPVRGLVIQSYGAGNIPSRSELLAVLKEAVSHGVLIINVTECPQGSVSASYEAGKFLEDIGVIPGYDMTAEAALTKLCYVLGLPGLSQKERITMMKTSLRGELTNNQQ